jgi:hypothetical protein
LARRGFGTVAILEFTCTGGRACWLQAMDFSHFTRIEREDKAGNSRHVVVHSHDPKLAVEFVPDTSAPDQVGQGVIRRVTVPNSWAGQYSQYGKIIAKAQAFFRASFAEPLPKGNRLAR